jgi:acyl-coenzyme A synthetase/AMP-(fatty) acid ligase
MGGAPPGAAFVNRLARLALAERPPGLTVAVGADGPLCWDRFQAEVGGAATALAGCRRALLSCADGWRFAVGLLALLTAGAEVVLAPNDRRDTLARLAGSIDRVIDDDFRSEGGAWTRAIDCARPSVHFYTSGSTGEAKCVARSLTSLDAEIAALDMLWGDRLAGATTLATVPHHHAFGLVFKLLWPLAAGRPFHTRQYDLWEDLVDALPDGGLVVTSPAHLTRLGGLPAPGRRPVMILSAGAPLPSRAATEAETLFGAPVAEIYGSTETGAIAARQRSADAEPAWLALPGYRVEPTADGMMRLVAPLTLADGSLELPDRIAAAGSGGFHLLGRADRIAKIEGKRVALDEIERELAALPQVEAARVLVLDAPRAVLAAVVVPAASAAADLAATGPFRWSRALRQALTARLEPAAIPRRWRFVAALPPTTLGKQRTADLAALFEEVPT